MTLADLEYRIARLEERVESMLDERRWFGRAFAVVALTTAAGVMIEVLRVL